MKPRFEEHEGKLFRMLDKPVPLTPDAEMPCLVRLIQDDSRMGMFNRDTKPRRLSDFYLAARIVNNNIIVDEFMESDYHRFEIIGYPVEDGSAEWALYQMMQGKKVTYKGVIRNVYLALNQDGNVQYYDMDNLAHIGKIRSKLEFVKNDLAKTGWQIYKEPELKYKVGDWVTDGVVVGHVAVVNDGKAWVKTKDAQYHLSVEHIRKLKPSEVEVDFGFAKGRILSRTSGDVKVLNNKSIVIATIIISEITNPTTRSLVESLLKAQEEK